jgi:hypothetical protein
MYFYARNPREKQKHRLTRRKDGADRCENADQPRPDSSAA